MSLRRKFRRPSLLDKHEAQERTELEVGKVEKAELKLKKIIKKVTRKN